VPKTRPSAQPSLITRLFGSLLRPRKSQNVTEVSPPVLLPLPGFRRLQESLLEEAFNTALNYPLPATVLYLAYGSNLCHETFQGRRKIRPLSAVNVVVPELELVFDLPGLPYLEPCFANSVRKGTVNAPHPNLESSPYEEDGRKELMSLLPSRNESNALIGVVYEVTAADYARIIATERPTYTDVVVTCDPLPTPQTSSVGKSLTENFKAHTLLAPESDLRPPRRASPPQPSLRYLTLCRNGAAEHSLPESWQSYLNHLQHYEATLIRQKIGRFVFIATWAPSVLLSFGISRLLGDKKGNAPKWVKSLTNLVFKAMWRSYDYFFIHVFGNGERIE
jgi:hypothetical protein